jgi:hypothetical protein
MAELNFNKKAKEMAAEAETGLLGLASMAAVYREQLLQHGFTREEAVQMSSDLVCALMTKSK